MAATKLPAEVPVTKLGRMPFSSNTWITPTCANPRAAPPPNANPILGGGFTTKTGTVGTDVEVSTTGASATGEEAQPAKTHSAPETMAVIQPLFTHSVININSP